MLRVGWPSVDVYYAGSFRFLSIRQSPYINIDCEVFLCSLVAGWPSVDAYYAGSSSSLSIPKVAVPLLCLSALDDPIAPKEAIPYKAIQVRWLFVCLQILCYVVLLVPTSFFV